MLSKLKDYSLFHLYPKYAPSSDAAKVHTLARECYVHGLIDGEISEMGITEDEMETT